MWFAHLPSFWKGGRGSQSETVHPHVGVGMEHLLRKPALPFFGNGSLKGLPGCLGIEGIARVAGMSAILGQIPKLVGSCIPLGHALLGQGHGIRHWQRICGGNRLVLLIQGTRRRIG